MSVYEMTTRELRKHIREKTVEVNRRIKEYRDRIKEGTDKTNVQVEKSINILLESTAAPRKNKLTGIKEYNIPKGYKGGEIGLGLSYKTKGELQKQLSSLERFEKYDIFTPEGQREWSDKVRKQYETFIDRYNSNMTEEEYEDMINTMNIVKNTIKDYGYEDFGKELARTYAKASKGGKRKFIDYVNKAKQETTGRTVDDLLDYIADSMRKDGYLE